MVRGTYRAIGQVGETEGANRLDYIVDKRPKEAGTGCTTRDRPRQGSPRRYTIKQTGT